MTGTIHITFKISSYSAAGLGDSSRRTTIGDPAAAASALTALARRRGHRVVIANRSRHGAGCRDQRRADAARLTYGTRSRRVVVVTCVGGSPPSWRISSRAARLALLLSNYSASTRGYFIYSCAPPRRVAHCTWLLEIDGEAACRDAVRTTSSGLQHTSRLRSTNSPERPRRRTAEGG